VFRHEPIWQYGHLDRQHADIVEAIGWISPPYRELARSLDRFPSVLAEGPEPYRERVVRVLDSPVAS